MKSYFYLLVFIFFIAQPCAAQTLVAYYPLNGNATDASGNALNGIINGAVTPAADRYGNANGAMSFPGSNGNINITVADNPLLKPASISISCWVKLNTPFDNSPKTFVDKAVGSCINDSWFLGTADNKFSGYVSNSLGCGDVVAVSAPQVDNEWKMIVFTVDAANSTRSLYVDGLLISTGSYTAAIPYDNTPLLLGAAYENGGLAFPLNGILDEVKIYNGVLSASQIATSYFNDAIPASVPGSGNAIDLNGNNNNVDLGSWFTYQDFTIDMWLKPGGTQVIFADIIDNNHSGSTTNWVCQLNTGGPSDTYIFGINGVSAQFALTPNVWQHLTLVKSATAIEAYVNGVLSQSNSYGAGPVNYSGNFLRLGRWGSGGRNWNGQMDEVRLWSTALTPTQIRDRMCHKITNSDPLYSNLVGYYDMDEMVGSTLYDKSGHANYGTLINSPARVTSGASIGDASAYDYANTVKTASISHPGGESFTVTSSSGNPDGIQVYRVDNMPNTLTGTQGVGSNNKYFGVFQAGGTSPQYTAVYNYNGNPQVNAGNENNVALFKRSNNADANWSNGGAVLNILSKTLTLSGESTEYILGNTVSSLPLTLISFKGQNTDAGNLLTWVTTDELNTKSFGIERSGDGIAFTNIGSISAANTNGNHYYSFTDTSNPVPISYYRLKMIDADGKFTQSKTIVIKASDRQSNTSFAIIGNPVANGVLKMISKAGTVTIINSTGSVLQQQNVKEGTTVINVQSLAPGVYWCKWIATGGETKTSPFIKQ